MSCDLHRLVDEAAEPISPQGPNSRSCVGGSVACGWVLMKRLVRAVGVAVREVLLQHRGEVAWSGDQEVVEAFAAQGAGEAFRDGVRSWCSTGCG
jgi:hypothetical protein